MHCNECSQALITDSMGVFDGILDGTRFEDIKRPLLFAGKTVVMSVALGYMVGATVAIKREMYGTPSGSLLARRILTLFSIAGVTYGTTLSAYSLLTRNDDYQGRAIAGAATGAITTSALSGTLGAGMMIVFLFSTISMTIKYLTSEDALRPNPTLAYLSRPRFPYGDPRLPENKRFLQRQEDESSIRGDVFGYR